MLIWPLKGLLLWRAILQESPKIKDHRRKEHQEPQSDNKKSSDKRERSEAEISAVVQFICLFWEEAWKDKWPKHSDPKFWDAYASAVNKTCNCTRTGLLK